MEDTGAIVGDAFSDVTLEHGLCAWIDILGTAKRGFPKKAIEQLIDAACVVSSLGKFDDKGFYSGISNARANVLLIGDAICITQKPPEAFKYVRDSVALVALFVSHNLFMLGHPHRGAIGQGTLEVGSRTGIRFVSGTSVLRAVEIEKTVKTTGLVIGDELKTEAETWQVPASEKPYVFLDRLGYRYITSEHHLSGWKKFCEMRQTEHPYIADSLKVMV